MGAAWGGTWWMGMCSEREVLSVGLERDQNVIAIVIPPSFCSTIGRSHGSSQNEQEAMTGLGWID